MGALSPPQANPAALWDPSLAALPDPLPWPWCVGVGFFFFCLVVGFFLWNFFFYFSFFFLERIKKYGFHE